MALLSSKRVFLGPQGYELRCMLLDLWLTHFIDDAWEVDSIVGQHRMKLVLLKPD